jgi:hypothetical protein
MSAAAVHAADTFDPSLSFVVNGERLGAVIIAKIREAGAVRVEFNGLRGLTSSFFNAALLPVGEALGPDTLRTKLAVEFTSQLQQGVYERSRDAVIARLSSPQVP